MIKNSNRSFGRILSVTFCALIVLLIQLGILLQATAQRFSGGSCISQQGTWLQEALQQSDTITSAINSIKNDKNCNALIEAVNKAPKYKAQVNDSETHSFVNMFRDLQAISDYMKPSRLNTGLTDKNFREIVFQVVFNKSFQAIENIHSQPELKGFSDPQKEAIKSVSLRLKHFQIKAQEFAELTMTATRGILAALPNSQLCMHNRPNEKAAFFGAIVHTAAALGSGGYINGVGETVASLMQYMRDTSYVNALVPMEKERFYSSVSCLIESTADSYCSIHDAEESLDFLKSTQLRTSQKTTWKSVIENRDRDPVSSSLSGLILLMRDVPVMQNWMQRVLFGIDPQMSLEGDMKNSYLSSYLNFVQKTNSLLADFRDKERLFYSTTQGKKNETKISQIREIFDTIISTSVSPHYAGKGSSNNGEINFFTRTMNTERIYFFLLGFDGIPAEVLEQLNKSPMGFRPVFDAWWNTSQSTGANNFNSPERILTGIRERLQLLIERAQIEANAFFAERMVVDPQLLLTEAMRGPGITPYQAFLNLKNYYLNLAKKLEQGAVELDGDPSNELRKDQLLGNIPLLLNSAHRIDKIVSVLKGISRFSSNDLDAAKKQSEDAMKVIYEIAYMLVARDSFFGMRLRTAVQADISDTLWRRKGLNEKQLDFFMTIAPEIISRLSGFFSNNPVLQRAEASNAKLIHIANMKSVESLFAKTTFSQIVDLDCKLYAGQFCDKALLDLDPTEKSHRLKSLNDYALASEATRIRTKKGKAPEPGFWERIFSGKNANQPTEDSRAHHIVRSKLCIQSLAFESRNEFRNICAGAELQSEFSDSSDKNELNMSYDNELEKIKKIQDTKNTDKFKIDKSRAQGVCAFRTYLRKNHVFYMYREINRSE